MNLCRAPYGALYRTYSISLFADDPRRPGATLAGRATRTPRRSSAVGSGCTRASPVNQRGCSRRGPCAEPPLWDAPRPGSLLAGIRWLFLATLFCEMWLTPSAAFVGRASAYQTSARSVHGTRHEHRYPGTQLHLGHDCCALLIVRALAVAAVGQPAGGSTRRWGDGRGIGFPRWSNVAPRSVCMQPSGNRRAGAPSVVDQAHTRAYLWGQRPCTLAGTRHAAPATRSIQRTAERARRAQTPHQQNRS
jgi:hypothetical protein